VKGAGRAQAERTLTAEQRKADFRPPEDGPPPPLDRPTGACELVAALLGALLRISATHLQGSNLAAFDGPATRRAPPRARARTGWPTSRTCRRRAARACGVATRRARHHPAVLALSHAQAALPACFARRAGRRH